MTGVTWGFPGSERRVRDVNGWVLIADYSNNDIPKLVAVCLLPPFVSREFAESLAGTWTQGCGFPVRACRGAEL